MVFGMFNLYEKDYKRYLIIPFALFILFIFFIFVSPGVTQGLDLKGGTSIIVRADVPLDSEKLKSIIEETYSLSELQVGSVSSPTSNGLIIQFSENTDLAHAEELIKEANSVIGSDSANAKQLALESIEILKTFVNVEDASSLSAEKAIASAETTLIKADEAFKVNLQKLITSTFNLEGELRFQKREIGPSLGENFYSTGIMVSLIAFFLVTLVILFFFREIVPSVAIILAIIFDIAGALALMAVFSIPLSLSTIPALLMLIGYSVDTDLMLTTRLLKRKEGTLRERASESMVTGLTMTFTTLAALLVMVTLSYFSQLQVIFEIASVLLFGLFADILSTWLMNAPMLLWYIEKKEGAE